MSASMSEQANAGADAWYLLHEGQRHGPFPISAFLKAVEEGTITKDNLIWRPGWSDWRSGRAAAELLGGPALVDNPDNAGLSSEALGKLEAAARDYLTPPPIPAHALMQAPPPAPDAAAADKAVKSETVTIAGTGTIESPDIIGSPPSDAERLAISVADAVAARSATEKDGDDPFAGAFHLKFLDEQTQTDVESGAADMSDVLPDREHDAPSRNYIAKHWFGELSLTKSYWINMILAVIAITFSAFALQTALQSAGVQGGPMALGAWVGFSLLVLVIVSWQLVGVWRSAAQHQERGGSPLWARAAQTVVVVGASAAVITFFIDSSRFASTTTFAAAAATDKVQDALARIPVYATLRRLDPAAFENITSQVAEEFRQGVGEDEIFTHARSALAATIQQYTPHASEDAILDMTEVMVSYMSALQATDPESCVALNDASTGAQLRANLEKQFPAIYNRELAVDNRILTTGANDSTPVPTEPDVKPQLDALQTELTQRFDQQLALLAKKDLAPSEYPTYCQIALALLQEIRRLPPKEAADLLRYVYAQS
jgi:hypothetical protein